MSVDAEKDLEPCDLLYPDLATENFQVYYRDHYKWYYISGQQESEAVIFLQSDNGKGALPGVPHCSFNNPNVPAGERPRESIETRLLVIYDD